jgi:PAS domain S-box-containing protein
MKFARKKKNDPFEIFFQNSNDAALLIDEDYKILNCNLKARDLLFNGGNSAVSQDIFEFIHDEDLSALVGAVTECKAGSAKSLSLKMRSKNGYVPFNVNVLGVNKIHDELNGFLIIAQPCREDNEEAVQTEKMNRLLQRLFNILESISDAFFSLDHSWNFKYINKKAEEILGKKRKKLYGKNVWTEFPSLLKNHLHEDFLKTMESRNSSHLETFFPEVNAWFDVHVYPFEEGISVFLQNINSRKRSENEIQNYIEVLNERNKIIQSHTEELKSLNEKLKASEKTLREMNANKDKLFSIIAHDLRNPFNSIMSYLDFLIEEYNEMEKGEALAGLQRLNKNVKLVFSLLENLLEWSRIQTNKIKPKPETLNLNELITETLYLLKENAFNKNIELKNLSDTNGTAFADKNMIASVLQNLVSNSIKFTGHGGSVEASHKAEGSYVIISVRDTGVGMNPENVSKLFKIEENVTTPGTNNEKGTGLGLILCKDLIEKNGGVIWCESKPGEGSVFSFKLPVTDKVVS